MKTHLITVGLLAAITMFTSAEQAGAPPSAVRKARMNDAPTDGVFLPLRTAPAELLQIDATGVTVSLPDVWDVDPATGVEYRRGELLVRFRDGANPAARLQALQTGGASRRVRTLARNWELVALDSGTDIGQAVAVMRRSAAVQETSPNYRRRTQQVRPNDESYGLQWNLDAINMPFAWEINPGGRTDVTVAVIDSGMNTVSNTFVFSSPIVGQIPVRFASVPDLVSEGRITNAYDFVYDDEFPVDLGGHGTHVAGTIAQQTHNNIGVAGVAYNVRLMPLKVISGESVVSWDDIFNPGNAGGSDAIIAEAIRYAADNGARVINLSLGGTAPAPALRDAIRYAVDRGAFVAMAAGNDGDSGNPTEYPAAYAAGINGAMAVGAVNRNRRRAAYSGFHPYVEICAPGGEATSDFDFERGVTQVGYEEAATLSFLSVFQKIAALRLGFRPSFDRFELRPLNGTSMATPHISGVAALLYSQGIRNPAAIEEAIERFAARIDARADECGAGLVDARRALRGLGLAR